MAHSITHPHIGDSYRYREADDDNYDHTDNRANEHANDVPAERVTHDTKAERVVRDETVAKRRYGGFNLGAAFFGWLVSTGLAVILAGVLSAAGAALAVTRLNQGDSVTAQTISTVGYVGGILFVVVLALAYYAGGYVAGRMSRYDGAQQGLGVWLIGLLAAIVLALLGTLLGVKYNVLQQINLPHIPVKAGSFTTGGFITSLTALIVSLLAALTGGKAGVRYHHKVDDATVLTHSHA